MKSLAISNELHYEWKVFCSNRAVSIFDATKLALLMAMKSKKIKKENV